MTTNLIAVIAALSIFIFVFELLRRGVLKEKYAVLWLSIAGIALILSVFPSILEWITETLGFEVPANLLFFGTIVVLVLVAVQLSYELSRHEARIRRLAEEVALLKQQIDDPSRER